MICFLNNNNDIYFNLATEEYFLKYKDEDIIMLWKSSPCVVVGKHQNTFAEINLKFIYEKKIPVARRLSGGGAVYHDEGDINYTFITNGDSGKLIDFKKFIQPVVNFLKLYGVDAEIGTKNDILVNGLKISGNAEHIYKNRVLHHGTLLFDSNLSNLKESLNVNPGRFTDKAVQSNRATVINISGLLTRKLTIYEFNNCLFTFLKKQNFNSVEYQFNRTDLEAINKLRDEKHSHWDWIFGYSPAFSLKCKLKIDDKTLNIRLYVEKGCVIKYETDESITNNSLHLFLNNLIGVSYQYPAIEKLIFSSGLDDYIKNQLFEGLL